MSGTSAGSRPIGTPRLGRRCRPYLNSRKKSLAHPYVLVSLRAMQLISDLPAVLAAIWHEAHAYRSAIHRSLSTVRCDLRLSAPGIGQDGAGTIRLDGD